MMKIVWHAGALLAGLLVSAPTWAELPWGSISFDQRVNTVGGNETIDVAVTFTLAADSPALIFAPGDVSAFDPADLPTEGEYWNPDTGESETRPFADYTGAYLNTYFGCGGETFTGVCGGVGSPYSFEFWLSSAPGKPSVFYANEADLQPGESISYVFGQFKPEGGDAPAGTYHFYRTGLTLNFIGLDAEGHELNWSSHTLGESCSSASSDCAFTRTVLPAVPEPQTYLMMALGLALFTLRSARRRP